MTNKIILLADDESSFRKPLAFLLEKEGYKVFQCENGVEAIMTARNETVDLMLLDIKMPNINGLSALESINDLQKHIPAIVMSAYMNEDITSKFPANVVHTFTKPFEINDLLHYIKTYFKNHGES